MDEQQRHTTLPTPPHRQMMPLSDLDPHRRNNFSRKNHPSGLHDQVIRRRRINGA
jgi:hypothetical protein